MTLVPTKLPAASQSLARLLITRQTFPDLLPQLQDAYVVQDNQDDADWNAEALRWHCREAEALLCVGSDQIDRALLQACPALKVVATATVGYNHIDLDACQERGIQVCNTPDVLTETTADFAWALLMAGARRVAESEQFLRQGQWRRWRYDLFLGADVHGARLGIIGMGRIGTAIARRAQGFSMEVFYHNRRPVQDAAATWMPLDELLRRSDFVVVVVPYTPQTHHLIDAQALALMPSHAMLINIARGGVVDDQALADALHQGRIAGAMLDVFENEPRINPDLLRAPRLLMTPHIASASVRTRRAMAQCAIDNLLAHARGEALLTPVVQA